MDEDVLPDSLRPRRLEDYVGQAALKAELEVRMESALTRGKPLDHVLLTGRPGYGKTSLAQIIAAEMDEPFIGLTGALKLHELAEIVRTHQGVLFLDEIHRWSPKDQESLLTLIEDGYLDIGNGRVIDVPWLTVVAATTERQRLIEPLVRRFPFAPEFDDYSEDEMVRIVLDMGERAGTFIDVDDAQVFARATAGRPRQARNLVLAYRDLDVIRAEGELVDAEDVLKMVRVDPDGLGVLHYRYLQHLAEHCEGGQGGLKTMCNLLGLKEGAVMDLERLLLSRGLIQLGNRGRLLTSAGCSKLSKGRAR